MASRTLDDDVDFDLEALKAKYAEERDRRVRKEGESQYIEVQDDFADHFEQDPYSDAIVRDSITEDLDVVVLGGGFAGLMAGSHLRIEGIDNFRMIEMAGDFGGTWYWNRYPGVQCDIESYCYLPLLEELNYVPKHKYSYGSEIFEHCKRIGEHFRLYDNALFQTRVTSIRWIEDTKRWKITTDREDSLNARFLIMATGPYNRAKLPGIPGIETFKGHSFHTSRWDYDYTGGNADGGLTKLADKKVAIIGTGATAIQAVPHLGRWAEHLYVFQRTPSAVDVRANRETDPEWAKSLKPGWSKERRENFDLVMKMGPYKTDMVSDRWTLISRRVREKLAKLPPEEITPAKFGEIFEIEDYRYQNDVRKRVDQLITKPGVADKLKAWYRWNCKRPTFHDEYLQTFNRDNVSLIDVSDTLGVEKITEKGIMAHGVEHEVDCIIYASGFEITTEMKRRIGIPVLEGRDGLSLYDNWQDGYRTLHGFTTHGFPNMFFTGFIQGGVSANLTTMYNDQTNHIAYIIREALDRGLKAVEVTEEAQDEWGRIMRETGVDRTQFLVDCTPGYYNNEGGKVLRSHLGEVYGPGYNEFLELLENWRNEGNLQGLVLEE